MRRHIGIVTLALLFTGAVLLAAWTYTQTFDGLTTADLNGQDSWSGSTEFDVQTGTVYEGTKAVSVLIPFSGYVVARSITAVNGAAEMYVVMRRSAIGGGNLAFVLKEGGSGYRIIVAMDNAGNLEAFDNSTGLYVSLLSYSANVWYPIHIQFDTATEQFRVRAYSGGSWGSYTAWLTVNGGSFDNITDISLEAADGSDSTTGYYDIITASDPSGGGGEPPASTKGLLTLGAGGGQH